MPIAGTSAGTAILSEFLYAALRKSVTSAEALADPFSRNITLDTDFLQLPFMTGIITDQHLIERDRMGRTLTFMARLAVESSAQIRAIAIDRETAVLVDGAGLAGVVANGGHATPYAYFMSGGSPQVVAPKTPLTYAGTQVQRAQPGSSFNLTSWTGTGLTSYVLHVNAGVVSSTQPGGSIY